MMEIWHTSRQFTDTHKSILNITWNFIFKSKFGNNCRSTVYIVNFRSSAYFILNNFKWKHIYRNNTNKTHSFPRRKQKLIHVKSFLPERGRHGDRLLRNIFKSVTSLAYHELDESWQTIKNSLNKIKFTSFFFLIRYISHIFYQLRNW